MASMLDAEHAHTPLLQWQAMLFSQAALCWTSNQACAPLTVTQMFGKCLT